MSNLRTLLLTAGLTVLGLLATGCASGPQLYYGATFDRTWMADATDESFNRVMNQDAASILNRKGLVVAFYPPDSCRNQSAAPDGSTRRDTLMLLLCGDFLAELESAMAEEGYEVVSWQLIGDQDPLARARELEVDLLFEINNLELAERKEAAAADTDIRFFSTDAPSDREAVAVEDVRKVGQRCFDAHGKDLPVNQQESAAMSLKVVSVQNGRSLWFFKRTVGDEAALVETHDDFFYRPDRVIGFNGRPLATTLFTLGAIFTNFGIASSVMTTLNGPIDPSQPFLPTLPLLAAGTGMLASGVAVTVIDVAVKANAPWEEPDDVICRKGRVSDPFAVRVTQEDEPEGSTAGESFSVKQSSSASDDTRKKRDRELVGKIVRTFLHDLRELKRTAPPEPPRTPAPDGSGVPEP